MTNKTEMKTRRCPHYNGSGYGYTTDYTKKTNVEFLFCDDCNTFLLQEMMKQMVIEHDLQKSVNVMVENSMKRMQGQINVIMANAIKKKSYK